MYYEISGSYRHRVKGVSNSLLCLDVAEELLRLCCGTCWAIGETAPVNFTDFYRTEPEDAGLTFPYMMSAVDHTYLANYVPVIKDPSCAYVKKKEGWALLYQIIGS